MISPELLRRYPFFGQLSDRQLESLAMTGEEVHFQDGQVILAEGKPADALYFLLEGNVDLCYLVAEAYRPSDRKEVSICQVNVGEPFGISTLIEPNILTSTAHSDGPSRMIRFDRTRLIEIMQEDPQLELAILRKVAKAAIERLHATRILLAAAWV